MLELKDLSKTYKPKKGVPVQALKGINLSFDETGLVFVLGKSGSGKSTLLNLIGGLDSADEGEIIIKGKSSKDFNTADYDAYRNTYIGFVFQEYNILNEFTVGENIMLALELQNKKADRQKLDEILKEVDLEGYADRKPNELSGGQKQRVAIARALIKQPQILMADEPTGALDSNTGKAILETLKRLSQNKLVIIVSHDREFAEEYGDRIIELADGEVISDTAGNVVNNSQKIVEKEPFIRSRLPYRRALKMGASGVKNKPLRLIITIILCMVSFTMFGVVDTVNSYNAKKVAVNSYIEASDYDVSAFTAYAKNNNGWHQDTNGASEQDVERLKEKTGIDYVGATYLNDINGCNLELVSKDKLIGNNSSIYYNQTIYGFFPASIDFFDTMGYEFVGELPMADNEIVITQYVLDQINVAGITVYTLSGSPLTYIPKALLPDLSRTAQSIADQGVYIKLDDDVYWKIVGVVDTKADALGKFDDLKPSDNRAETYQSLHIQDCVEHFRYGYHSLGYISQDNYNNIVNSHKPDTESWESFGAPAKGRIKVREGKNYVKFQFVASDKDFDKVKDIIWLDGKERTNLQDNEYVIGFNAAISLLQDEFLIESNIPYTHTKTYFEGIVSIKPMSFHSLIDSLGASRSEARFIACFEEAERISIEQLNIFKEFVYDKGEVALSHLYSELNVNTSYVEVNYAYAEKEFEKLEEKHWRMLYAGYLLRKTDWSFRYATIPGDVDSIVEFYMPCGYFQNVTGGRTGQMLENIDAKLIYILNKLNTLQEQKVIKYNLQYSYDDVSFFSKSAYEDSTIVGIYIPQDYFPCDNNSDAFVFNNNMYRDMEKVEPLLYSFLLAPMPTERTQLEKLMDIHYEEGERIMKMHNGIIIELDLVQVPINMLSFILLYAGLGLALFAVLMMGNYITVSISNKKREIGILRALGAKGSDVFSIFVNESIIIALINVVVSIVATVFACIGINVIIKNMTGVDLSVLNFGVRQIAIMILISLAVAIAASLIPIYRLSKKKPIDCIQDR
ncbi:MAG: ATP-binding cassette domain-containing protein [Clostridia bacterium]|nr:ATP-binding cassette domain-containing protein [Clostridia bacterium]